MGNTLMFADFWLHTVRDEKVFYVVGRATIEKEIVNNGVKFEVSGLFRCDSIP